MRNLGKILVVMSLLLVACQGEELDSVLEKSAALTTTIPDDAVVIDFEGFVAGDIVSTVSPSGCDGEVSVYGTNPIFPGDNVAMVFDSSNPTGEDYDLGTPNQLYGGPGISSDSGDGNEASNDTPMGNVLIISEDLDASDPDDSYVAGSKYDFDFSGYGVGYVTMYGFNMIDLDAPGKDDLPTVVKLYDDMDNLLLEKVIPYGPDNAVQWVDLEGTAGVVKMTLELNNSGAIDNIKFTCPKTETVCETAFGLGDYGTCFSEYGFSRWGWTNGPVGEGQYTFDVWAGAGQCDTDKGEWAGTVTVTYGGGTVSVEYDILDEFEVTETHVYAGSNPIPTDKKGKETVAPGQYKVGSDLSGDIYIIVHLVVCKEIIID